MYATRLFCNSALGANESIEHFPIGKRLAFDAANGRLWVVCIKCERWNLSLIEKRWEAIEAAERAFRDTKKRSATDNIGMAPLTDGTELMRIASKLPSNNRMRFPGMERVVPVERPPRDELAFRFAFITPK